MHGTTFGGNPLACAVAIAVVDEIKQSKLLAHVTETGDYFLAQLRALQQKHSSIVNVRGLGLMIGVELDSEALAKDVLTGMTARRILLNRTHETVLRFLPPYLITKAHGRSGRQCARRNSHAAHECFAFCRRQARTNLKELTTKNFTENSMENKTIAINSPVASRPVTLGIQSDTAFTEVAKGLTGRDLVSIADLSVSEMAAIMELAHAVKTAPEDFRHGLDAKQMVMFFEKASLRTRLTFEVAMKSVGGGATFVDQTASPLGERESIPDIARNLERWMDIIVLRTYSHDTIIEMAANARIPVINALSDLEHPCQAIGRLHDPRRALWLDRRPQVHLRRRRQ